MGGGGGETLVAKETRVGKQMAIGHGNEAGG